LAKEVFMGSIHPIDVPATGFLDPKLLIRQRELLKEAEESRLQRELHFGKGMRAIILFTSLVLGALAVKLLGWVAFFVLVAEFSVVNSLLTRVENRVFENRVKLIFRYRAAYFVIDNLIARDSLVFAAGEPQYFEHVVPLLDRAS
jgi:hypothetical protein